MAYIGTLLDVRPCYPSIKALFRFSLKKEIESFRGHLSFEGSEIFSNAIHEQIETILESGTAGIINAVTRLVQS